MARIKINEASLRRILERQEPIRWAKDYVAAIHATPAEAPSISIASILRPKKLGFRETHLLSAQETKVVLLALFYEHCWEIHEQRILAWAPTPHPLQGHSNARDRQFPALAGTLDVAERMGMLSKHPRVVIRSGEDPRNWRVAPFPYTGDLLLFIGKGEGAYCVNWTIKNKLESFRRRAPTAPRKRMGPEEDTSAIRRHLLEKTYYEDAGIRTQQVAGEAIDFHLYANLRDLFLVHGEDLGLCDASRSEAIGRINEAVGVKYPANHLARELAQRYRLSEQKGATLIKQAIWERQVRVDLFQPFRIDRPLVREREDPFERYGSWLRA